MNTVSADLRNRLAATIKSARRAGEPGARNALGILAVGDARAHPSMSPAEQDLRRRLRAHGRQLGDGRDSETGEQKIDRLAHEVAYEHWHRMLFARFLAENELLIEPESGVAVSLADCEELAHEQGQDRWTLAGRFAESMLPRIFRSDDPALAVRLAPETRQELERLIERLPADVFTARDALGWTYQFWQAERKDAVNKSGVKIGPDELPAVTQLFTERYMVLFLLHNTVGAWRAARILAAQPELAATAASEEELRQVVRLEADGGYDFSYLRFVREPRDGDEAGQPTGPWRPAAGRFEGWPRMAADLRVFDPCCGSGHFLIESLDLLVRLRMEEERLAPGAAIDAVLRDNLFGLEIDPRCTQIAAFNLALTAWTWPDAGGYRRLPDLNLACSGLAPNAPRDEWARLSDDAADAGELPPKRDLLGAEDTLMSAPLRNSLGALHDLFAQAPVLGSLIDPRAVEADLFQHDYESVRVLLGALLERERGSDERTERAVAAEGMARAAELLAGRYHLVITNVPYLARGKQSDDLKQFAQDRHPAAKGDLATLFVSRVFGWLDKHGAQAVVTPQNWLFLTSYKKLRETLLKRRTWNLVARLGPGAFETIGGHVVNVALSVLSADRSMANWRIAGIDVSAPQGRRPTRVDEKAGLLRGTSNNTKTQLGNSASGNADGVIYLNLQKEQLDNPENRVALGGYAARAHLSERSETFKGICSGDSPRFQRAFWELVGLAQCGRWAFQQSSIDNCEDFAGRQKLFLWDDGGGEFVRHVHERLGEGSASAWIRGGQAWGRTGVVVKIMGDLPVTRYTGEIYDNNVAVIVPRDDGHLPAIWTCCSSDFFRKEVRRLNAKLSVTDESFVAVPFDLAHWQKVAAEHYPNGLPEPYSDDPTQWIFHGHPCGSVVWDEETKWTSHGPRRVDATVLQVAVARILGYRWPAEHDPDMRMAAEMRTWVARCSDLDTFADADGIVCLSSIGGDPAAADRLRQLLAVAYGADWSVAMERQLLVAAAGNSEPAESIETWLRDRFFEEHCQLFHQRSFTWHIWDGRRDGFHALVNYHRLAGGDGAGRRTLETLTYSHLGDWMARQEADRDRGLDGADGRLAAAHDLQKQLKKIIAGEPPCDLFVRWKSLGEQPIGWEPDINDGVRINIRPFMSAELSRGGRVGAGVLRAKPRIAWKKDRGKEALKPGKRWEPPWSQDDDHRGTDVEEDRELRPREEYPWFWSCPGAGLLAERRDFLGGPEFDGNRWNDLHYTNAVKRTARSRSTVEAGS